MAELQPPTGSNPEPQANPAMVVRRRPASVNFRDGSGEGGASLMDPANQSLADALKITYRILQVGMLGLVGMFAFSGLQSVQTGEKGIRVVLGAIQSDDLAPGFQFSLPRPLGEIIKVSTGIETISLRSQFFPAIGNSKENENKSLTDLSNSARDILDPSQDGAMLSGDLGLAHGRFTLQYQRRDIKANTRNIDPEFEQQMVRAAAVRGITHAASRLSVDEILNNRPDANRKGEFPSLDYEARRLTQQALDQVDAGIDIVQFNAELRSPPLRLLSSFASVQTRQSEASKDIQQAQTNRAETLANVAGEAAPVLLDLIDRYEKALATGSADAEKILSTIDDAMAGRPIEIDGKILSLRITGRVAAVMSESQQYRSSVVSRAQADARVFEAKLAAFKANPNVVLTGDWSEALATFLNRDTIQVFMLPGGKSIDLWLNRDPELAKAQEAIRTRKEAERIELERMRKVDELQLQNFKNIGTTTEK